MPRAGRGARQVAVAEVARRGAQRIEWWPVERLRPYDRNPRRHPEAQIVALMALITEVGFNVPILVDGNAGIIAGHGRLEAAKRLGMAEVAVIELTHMSEVQKRAQIIADARITSMGAWDEHKLAAELHALENDRFDIALTGFSEDDLQRLQDDLDHAEMRDMAGGTAPAQIAAAPPGATEPSSSSGAGGSADAAAPTASSGEAREEQLPFSVVMAADDRARLFEAINAAKRKWGLNTAAHALLAMANDFLSRETS